MNSAFEGKKPAPNKDKKKDKSKEQRLKSIMAEAAQLDPILEENNDMALAVYKPNMSLQEQRKLKTIGLFCLFFTNRDG